MGSPNLVESKPLITLFTTPKPFSDKDSHTNTIQRNAIASWSRLPRTEVILLGNEAGIAEAATELGVRHIPHLQYNENGTPLVSSAFEIAKQNSSTPWLAYCNSDVILLDDFVDTLIKVEQQMEHREVVVFGRRIDLAVKGLLDLDSDSLRELKQTAIKDGVISTQLCKEYFIFGRTLYSEIPPFAIGRGNWDNWMIWSAKKKQIPVINAGDSITAIHQDHHYQHARLSRRKVYVSGAEAKKNQSLAEGCHWVSGSVGSHRLTKHGIVLEKKLLLNPHFWADIPRFVKLVFSLMLS